MRYALLSAGILMVGWLIYQRHFKTPPPPPEPPAPPPAISKQATPVLSPEELRRVVEATRDTNPQVRREALNFLLQVNLPEADEVLLTMVSRDDDPAIRRHIITLLQGRQGPRSRQAIVGALNDHDPDVRLSALQAVQHLGDYSPETAAAITGLLRDSEERVRLQALQTLSALQKKKEDDVRQEAARQEVARQEAARRAAEEEAKRKGR